MLKKLKKKCLYPLYMNTEMPLIGWKAHCLFEKFHKDVYGVYPSKGWDEYWSRYIHEGYEEKGK